MKNKGMLGVVLGGAAAWLGWTLFSQPTGLAAAKLTAGRYYMVSAALAGVPPGTKLTADDIWVLFPQLMSDMQPEPFTTESYPGTVSPAGNVNFLFKAARDNDRPVLHQRANGRWNDKQFTSMVVDIEPYAGQ